jgi:hypothetical protein
MLAENNKELLSRQLSEAFLKSSVTIEEINTIFRSLVLAGNEVKLTRLDINNPDSIELEVTETGKESKKYKAVLATLLAGTLRFLFPLIPL